MREAAIYPRRRVVGPLLLGVAVEDPELEGAATGASFILPRTLADGAFQ